jgi:hypothetical protein
MKSLLVLSFFLSMMANMTAQAKCTSDIECKGDRICSNGICQNQSKCPNKVTPQKNPAFFTSECFVVTSTDTNLRDNPMSTTSATNIIAPIPVGDKVNYLKAHTKNHPPIASTWVYVEYNSQKGWVTTCNLSPARCD